MTRRIDYPPICGPDNPQSEAARAAMREYYAAMRGETMVPEHEQPPAAALIEAVLTRWPDMARYADTAEVGEWESLINGTVKPCVTVTVFEVKP